MNYAYITIAAIPAPQGSVVIEFGANDEPWCDVMPCLGLAIQAKYAYDDNDNHWFLKKRTTDERVVPIHEDVDEWGLGPSQYEHQMMLVTPLTSRRDVVAKIIGSSSVPEQDAQAVYDVVLEALASVGIYPQ